MKVFVDPLCENGWRLGKNCHLFIEPETPLEVLHEFALVIGMKRVWFQHKLGKLPHYDLTKSRRDKAILHGAVELNRADSVLIWRVWRRIQEPLFA